MSRVLKFGLLMNIFVYNFLHRKLPTIVTYNPTVYAIFTFKLSNIFSSGLRRCESAPRPVVLSAEVDDGHRRERPLEANAERHLPQVEYLKYINFLQIIFFNDEN